MAPALLTLDICVQEKLWQDKGLLPALSWLKKVTLLALTPYKHKIKDKVIISLSFTNDAEIALYNAQYRHKNAPTNILSFPLYTTPQEWCGLPGSPTLIGECIVALETILQEHKALPIPFQDYLCFLLIHGVLHLQGFDHETDADAQVMQAHEVTLWEICHTQKLVHASQNPYTFLV